MKKHILILMLVGIFITINAKSLELNFENNHPYPWQSVSTWKVDKNSKILSMIGSKKSFFGFGNVFNLYFTKSINFKDGEITVEFKANSGDTDEGGGIMWRVQDKDNYYIARFNPLEDNFTYYKVIKGDRIELKNSDIKLSSGWHKMKIIQKDTHFEGFLDGKKLLEFNDNSIQKSGGIGVWTKTDAKTSFKNLLVEP